MAGKRQWLCFLLVFSVFFTCFLTGCDKKEVEAVLDVSRLPEDLDPQTTEDENARLILINVMEGLTRKTADGEICLAAAKDYSVSEDGLRWTFHLRPSAWSDGVDVTADDFVFAFQRLFASETGAVEKAKEFSFLTHAKEVLSGKLPVGNIGVYAEDETTLVFSLETPQPDLLSLLSQLHTLPCRRDFFEKTGGSYGLSRTDLLYNGPYAIQYWLDGEYIIMRANSRYGGERGNCARVAFYETDEAEIATRFLEGETNLYAGGLPSSSISGKGLLKKEITDTVYTLLLNQKSPRLKDALLRSALLQTVDQGFVPQENTGGYMVQKDLLPPAIRLAPKTNAAKADPDGGREALRLYLAKEELEKTGAFTILLPKAGFHREMLTLLQQAWQKELGVYVNLDLVEEDVWQDRLKSGDYELALLPVKAETDSALALLEKFASGGEYATFGFSSKAFTDALSSAKKAETEADLLSHLQQALDHLMGSGSLMPLYSSARTVYYTADLSGIEIDSFGSDLYFATAGLSEET